MKKLFFPLFIIVIFALALGVCAAEKTVSVGSGEDIISAVNGGATGDIIELKLTKDIELNETVNITNAVNIIVAFNGNSINYNGNGERNTTAAAFHIANENATLTLVGSNPMTDHEAYAHYGDSVKADMTGTGNLISVSFGTVNIQNAYLFAHGGVFVVYGAHTSFADYTVTAKNSVLRVDEGADASAISYKGGKENNRAVIKRRLILEDTVEYGGFFGTDYNFNLTKGSKFTRVKFYDFYIKNDCWYDSFDGSTRSALMVNVDEALEITDCIFNKYDGSLGTIKIYTETAKQNLRLYNCQYTALESGGAFKGDNAGTACVYIIKTQPTCETDGVMDYYANGLSESNKTVDAVVKKGQHVFGKEIITYPNGYTRSGVGVAFCTICEVEKETDSSYLPIFSSLGYSVNGEGNGFVMGARVNGRALEAYEESAGITLEYGMLAGKGSAALEIKDGEITASDGYAKAFSGEKIRLVEIKISGFDDTTRKKDLVAEIYVYDGTKITFVKDEDCEKPSVITLEKVINELDVIKQKVNKLLESKHKLYYNDDGSFRVLVIADVHMSAWSDATNVQTAKDRIKMLVDRENPNLVIFTGDNTIGSSSADKLRQNIDAMAGYLEEKKIPWCHVYGNHDHEGALSHAAQQEIYEEYEYCISKSEEGLSSVGNYVHGIYKRDGTLGGVVYLINSNTYDTVKGGYDYIKDDQIAWYKETSELLEEYNGGKAVRGIMAFHIPLIENNTAYNNRNNKDIVYEFTGDRNENICASATDTNLLETIFERGDIKAIVTGHDHVNDYMLNYKGVKLCSSPNVSDLTYTNATLQGGRVFDMAIATMDNIPTYVSYVIERINPDKYGKLDANITLESFDGAEPEMGVSGYDASGLSGTMTLGVAQGKGKDGTSALEIKRSNTDNSEFYVYLSEDDYGKLGSNKYLVVWMDFTNVEFRKACVGLLSTEGVDSYRADDDDGTKPPYYYLADGATEWQSLNHGGDGCFGAGDGGGVKGKRGYFAFKIEDLLQSGRQMNENTLVTGFYMYLSTNGGYANTPFYVDDIMLVEDYKTVK